MNVSGLETVLCFSQGNLVAIKYINRKRIELTRNVLFELKHVSLLCTECLKKTVDVCVHEGERDCVFAFNCVIIAELVLKCTDVWIDL